MKLYLARHGRSKTNEPGGYWAYGPQSIPLSPEGERQAAQFAQDWQIKPDIFVASPYTRSIQTLAPLVRKFNAPVLTLPVQEFTYWNLLMTPSEYAGRQADLKLYWDQLDTLAKRGEGSENFEEFLVRVLAFRKWAAASPYNVCVCVSHGFFMHAFRLVMRTTEGPADSADSRISPKDLMRELRDTLPESSYANLAVETYNFESQNA